jgi:dephospho-CoA kinase
MKVVSIVGMAGSGKSEVARVFEGAGFARVRFGDITDEEVHRRRLDLNEKNERLVRQQLREEHGMAAYAKLSLPKIDRILESGSAVVDGLYSWEEYILMKDRYGGRFAVVAVWASPETRHLRLSKRPVRPLTPEEAASRDVAEIQNLNKGGPIAMADFTILNESSMEALERETRKVLAKLKSG